MIEVQPDLDSTLRHRFAAPAEEARVRRTAAALEANGITVRRGPEQRGSQTDRLGSHPGGVAGASGGVAVARRGGRRR